ncbi:MAG: glycosyltransferase [Hyphomicrobium sp.]
MTLPKLLFYTHGLVDGGAERLWSCLASAFKARGYEVVFVVDFPAKDNLQNLDPAIRLHTLGKGHIQAIRKLADVLKAERPHVTLSAVGGSNTKLLAAIALSGVETQPIITYHGYEEWKSGLLSLATYVSIPLLSAASARTVAVSDGLRNTLVKSWHARAAKTVTIHNPVFFPETARVPTTEELARREDVVLAVGRLAPVKEYATLIRAFARLKRPNARLVILGKGPEERAIRALAARLGIADRVEMPGYLPDPWKAYETAKCFVLSSRSEPFGNVVVEALAHGLPVVTTACSGPLEILQHGKFGKIVPVGDDLQFADALSATLADPGDPAPRRARADQFSFPVRVPAYEKLVADVLAEAHAMPAAASLLSR